MKSGLGSDPATPLWRAAQGFRLLSCLYALGFLVAVYRDLDRPVLTWMLFGVLIAWNIVCAVAYLQGFGRRAAWVLAELAVVVAFILSTTLVASAPWMQDNQPWVTTLWATNVTVSAAIQFGPFLGMGAGLVVIVASAVLKDSISVNLGRHATIVIELAVGLAVGMAALIARRAHAELERATRLAAALEERERLSREVHDGAIQVLALVARRGREMGGAGTELAELAGQQERALRRLVSGAGELPTGERVDLVLMLGARESDRVSASLPASPVLLDEAVAAEVDAAVRNALDNVAAHAGPDAHAYILLEDLDETVVVSVRDDGPGIPEGRLEEAVGEGHIGIAKSIVGRMEAVGGSATLATGAGVGTEWELTVPRGEHG
jgi:signal transduction histidine kinase